MSTALTYVIFKNEFEAALMEINQEKRLNKPIKTATDRRDELWLNGQAQGIRRVARRVGLDCKCTYRRVGGERCLCSATAKRRKRQPAPWVIRKVNV